MPPSAAESGRRRSSSWSPTDPTASWSPYEGPTRPSRDDDAHQQSALIDQNDYDRRQNMPPTSYDNVPDQSQPQSQRRPSLTANALGPGNVGDAYAFQQAAAMPPTSPVNAAGAHVMLPSYAQAVGNQPPRPAAAPVTSPLQTGQEAFLEAEYANGPTFPPQPPTRTNSAATVDPTWHTNQAEFPRNTPADRSAPETPAQPNPTAPPGPSLQAAQEAFLEAEYANSYTFTPRPPTRTQSAPWIASQSTGPHTSVDAHAFRAAEQNAQSQRQQAGSASADAPWVRPASPDPYTPADVIGLNHAAANHAGQGPPVTTERGLGTPSPLQQISNAVAPPHRGGANAAGNGDTQNPLGNAALVHQPAYSPPSRASTTPNPAGTAQVPPQFLGRRNATRRRNTARG